MNVNFNELISVLGKNHEKFSPVQIIGENGLGKTYTLGKIKNFVPGAKTLKAREVAESLIDVIKSAGDKALWRTDLLEHPILLIDDIDYICGKETVQQELLWVFEQYDRPIVVTSEKPLYLQDFSGKFVTFFSKGACVTLPHLNPKMQKEYLLKYIEENKLGYCDDVVELICKQSFSGYSAMQGFMKTLELYWAQGQKVTAEMCRYIINNQEIKEEI